MSVKSMCELLSISRSGYYRAAKSRDSLEEDLEIRDQIHRIALEWPSYGYRRIAAELRRQNVPINHKRVLKLMRADNLLCVRKKRFVRTTRSDHELAVYPNLADNLCLTGMDQLWVADITYIRVLREFIFLAVILDAFSRRCIGWQLSRYIDTKLTLGALQMALKNRQPKPGTIHHSDRGVQYAATQYVDLLASSGLLISMSRKGNPYDNARAESFMKTLKYEEVHLLDYRGINEAYQRISHFLEDVYNQKRLHSALGYRPPVEFEHFYSTNQLETSGSKECTKTEQTEGVFNISTV